MLPAEAPPHDWRLYYDRTVMLSTTLGPVEVHVRTEDGAYEFYAKKIRPVGTAMPRTIVPKDTLRILWPRPGAYNIVDGKGQLEGVVVVGRKPCRQMKRSAHPEHYYIIWNGVRRPINTTELLRRMTRPAPHPTFEEAGELLTPDMTSVALDLHVLLVRDGDEEVSLYYNGESIGVLSGDKLIPFMPGDSRMRRYKKDLRNLGIRV